METTEGEVQERRIRARHEVWLCNCAICTAEQDNWRRNARRVRRRLFEPDSDESDNDPTVRIDLVAVIDRAPLDNE